jgi:hypothetical protein
MFDLNGTAGENDMTTYAFDDFLDSSAVAAAVTLIASAWFLVAAVAMMGAPTDTTVARAASVSVKPLGVIAAPVPGKVAFAPDVRETIVVTARRA